MSINPCGFFFLPNCCTSVKILSPQPCSCICVIKTQISILRKQTIQKVIACKKAKKTQNVESCCLVQSNMAILISIEQGNISKG